MKPVHQYRAWGLPDFAAKPSTDRRRILAAMEFRRNAGATAAVVRDEHGETWGHIALAVPLLDYAALIAANPELNSKDKETYERAWTKLARGPLGRLYAADDSIGKRKRNTRIIVK